MPESIQHKMVAALQSFARAIIPVRPEQQFLLYWTELVEKAGVDLFAKAGLEREEHWDERPEKVAVMQVAVSEDLTFAEIMSVAVYLQDRYADLLDKWEKHIIQTQQQKEEGISHGRLVR